MNAPIPGTLRLLARFHVGCASSEEIIAWAVGALVDGYDSKDLRVLAGEDPAAPRSKLGPLLFAALQQLGISTSESPELYAAYLRQLARAVVDGTEPLDVLLREIADVALCGLGRPISLVHWSYLEEGLDPATYLTLSEQKRNEAAVRHAKELLAAADGPGTAGGV